MKLPLRITKGIRKIGEGLGIEALGSPARDSTETGRVAGTTISHGRYMALGTLKFLAVRALALATGLLIATFLTRQLGPELYGLYTVAATIVIWVEVSTTSALSNTTMKFVPEAVDWRLVASTLAQAQLLVGLGATAFLVAAAPALASWLRSPELETYLRLFALDIPIFALARVHQSTLIGQGAFKRGAFLIAVHWLIRMMLVFLLVGWGLSVTGAILASIGASLAQLIVARVFVRLDLMSRSVLPIRLLGGYALPLFFYAIGMRLFTRLDLLVVKALGVTPAAAGYYGAAQNLTVPSGLFVTSLTPLLLATVTRVIHQGQVESSRSMVRETVRLVLCLLPLAGLVAGAASEIVRLVYGDAFLPAAPLLSFLIFGAVGNIMISVVAAVLTAAGQPGWTAALAAPLLPLALGAHLILVPRFGPLGAAAATTVLTWLGASAATLAVYRQYGVYPAPVMMFRITLATLISYTLASTWQIPGLWLVAKLLGLTAVVLICLFLLGELTEQDLTFAWSLLRRERARSPTQVEREL